MIEFVKVIGAGMVGAIVGTLMTKSSNHKKYNKIVDDCVDVCITAYIVCGVSIVDLKSYLYDIIPANSGYPVNRIFKDAMDKIENILGKCIV